MANLVIERDSAINFVKQEVIDELHWSTKMLLKLYKVTWTNDYAIPMTHRCLVSFKIDSYEDGIWCDVIPLNVTHFLWGRP